MGPKTPITYSTRTIPGTLVVYATCNHEVSLVHPMCASTLCNSTAPLESYAIIMLFRTVYVDVFSRCYEKAHLASYIHIQYTSKCATCVLHVSNTCRSDRCITHVIHTPVIHCSKTPVIHVSHM